MPPTAVFTTYFRIAILTFETMAKLTRHTGFKELKSMSRASKVPTTEECAHLSDFEVFLFRLRNEFSDQKKAKSAHGK